MPVLHGQARWPGAVSVLSCEYTCTQGIAPGVAQLTLLPQSSNIALVGDLVLYDGRTTVTIPRCKVDRTHASVGGAGRTVTVPILDRRWLWPEFGSISGWYNQYDPYMRILPWTRKLPSELCKLCLDAAGERNYRIAVPDLELPPVSWEDVPPMQALAGLARQLGCEVVYRLDTDTVWVVRVGDGGRLPNGPLLDASPSLDIPERPDTIVVVGDPVRYQCRLKLEPVALDWDNFYRPLSQVSYKPVPPAVAVAGVVRVTPSGTVVIGDSFTVTLTETGGNTTAATFVATAGTVANVTAGLTAAFNGLPLARFAAADAGTRLDITGPPGLPFGGVAVTTSAAAKIAAETTTLSADPLFPWDRIDPVSFAGLVATDRITRVQAISLAQQSVWRSYRVMAENLDGTRPLRVPGYDGEVHRFEQLLLEANRVELITPQPVLDDAHVQLGPDGKARKVEFFDGHRRERLATAYGRYYTGASDLTAGHTSRNQEVSAQLAIDPIQYVVTFSFPIYQYDGRAARPADVLLETAFTIRDFKTNAVDHYKRHYIFPPPRFGTAPAYFTRPDLQFWVRAVYDIDDVRRFTTVATNAPAVDARALHYLTFFARRYEISGGESRRYDGLQAIFLDGAIRQVTWRVGEPSGAETSASVNTEHDFYLPSLQQRDRLMHLAARMRDIREDKLNKAEPPGWRSPGETGENF